MVTKPRSKERQSLTDASVPRGTTKRVDNARKRAPIRSFEENSRNESQCPGDSRTPRSEPATRTNTGNRRTIGKGRDQPLKVLTSAEAGFRRADRARRALAASGVMVAKQAPNRPQHAMAFSLQIHVGWQPDTVAINDEGQQVWLKDAFTRKGERIGVGPCCLESDPCAWHHGLDGLEQRGFPLSSSKYSH